MAIYVQDTMAQLVAMLAEKRSSGQQPVLFLGNGVARAANVPAIEDMARDLYLSITGESPAPQMDAAKVVDACYQESERLEPFQRQSLLQSYFATLPVPDFYFDLVQLLIDEVFLTVVTTSIDPLLEQALSFSGLRRDEAYLVVKPERRTKASPRLSKTAPSKIIKIVKLNGELPGFEAAITPDELQQLLIPQRSPVQSDHRTHEIVLVGYNLASEPANKWIARTQAGLWWVSPVRPEQNQVDSLGAARLYSFLDGSNADPKQFFGILRMGLQSLTEPIPKAPISKYTLSIESYPTEAAFPRGGTSMGDSDIEPQFLVQRLDQHVRRKRELEAQALYVSAVDQNTETQIAYESTQISAIQQRLVDLGNR